MPANASGDQSGDYTAVVYVHGMGEQRRYRETCELVEALGRYWRDAGEPPARDERIAVEPARTAGQRDVTCVALTRGDRSFRFYEAYWAQVTAGGRRAMPVVWWLVRQVFVPPKVLLSRWVKRKRHRRESLYRLHGIGKTAPVDFPALLERYRVFGDNDRGESFHDFVTGPQPLGRTALGLARRWRRRTVVDEIVAAAAVTSVVLMLVLGMGAVIQVAIDVAVRAWMLAASSSWPPSPRRALASLCRYACGHPFRVVLGMAAPFVASFLRSFVGDIQTWATYQETDVNYRKRRQILDEVVALMSHVLLDERCTRVVVVAHSLGSAIAVDALLELGRANRARSAVPLLWPLKLAKLDALVTLASPIDKIHHFFESRPTPSRLYDRVVDEVRGDLGAVPFAQDGGRRLQWVNLWDAADVISGSLESPGSAAAPPRRVRNVRVRTYLLPDPAASHMDYLRNRQVLRTISTAVFEGRARPGKRRPSRLLLLADRCLQLLGLAVPWLMLFFLWSPGWAPVAAVQGAGLAAIVIPIAWVAPIVLRLVLRAFWRPRSLRGRRTQGGGRGGAPQSDAVSTL
jgi:hypothetical protein